MTKLLLFGGTTEGRELSETAVKMGFSVTLCVATEYGKDCAPAPREALTVRVGRLDEGQMCQLMAQGFSCCVDATHPYAAVVSQTVRTAANAVGLPCLRLLRPESALDDCVFASSVSEACTLVPPGNVLAATGSKEIAAYRCIPDYQTRVYARVLPLADSLAACRDAGLAADHILAAKGPFSQVENERVLRDYQIASLITKDGGKNGGLEEKLLAARACDVTVIAVRRPDDQGLAMPQIIAALAQLPHHPTVNAP